MGIFSRFSNIFSRETSSPASTSPDTPRTGGVLFGTASEQTAMSISTVYACVRILSDCVASMPLQYMYRRKGIMVADTAGHMDHLLNVEPDKGWSAPNYWREIVRAILLEGNAYIVPIYGTDGALERLVLCGHGTVSHDTTRDTYTVNDPASGLRDTYAEDAILHFKGPASCYDRKRGVSVLTFARLTTQIASTADRETLDRFAGGGIARGFISNERGTQRGVYKSEQLEKAADRIERQQREGRRIFSVPGDVNFKQLALSSADMQFLESRKFSVREICRFFGVPPSFVFDDTSNNYKSVEQANIDFLSHTLNPMLRGIEIELLRKLVPQSRCGRVQFKFARQQLHACDLDSKTRYQQQALSIGLYTPNELRAEENKAPLPGGDTMLVSANLRGINEIPLQNAQEIDEK